MQLRKAFSMVLVGLAVSAGAQNVQYTEFLGEISVGTPVLPLAGSSTGDLYFGTFNAGSSSLYVIPDPASQINEAVPAVQQILAFTQFPAQRGLQSLQVTADDHLLIAGDSGAGNVANVWRLNRTGTGPADYTLDTNFSVNADLAGARRSAVSIFSEDGQGGGVLIVNGLNHADFFSFDGTHLAGPFEISADYMREAVYNSQDNVYYIIRNGDGSQVLLDTIWTDLSLAGGTLVSSVLIEDGASNGEFGGARQNAYYYAEQNQLITMDGDVTISSTRVPPKVRVWNISDNGTSLDLAYSIEGTSDEAPFVSLGDAVVIDNRLYVSSSGLQTIYVFGPGEASVDQWEAYESGGLSTEMSLQ